MSLFLYSYQRNLELSICSLAIISGVNLSIPILISKILSH